MNCGGGDAGKKRKDELETCHFMSSL
jgi:hypothetical protein